MTEDTTDDDFDFFTVDPDKLDEQWFIQPDLVYKHSRNLAETREVRDRAKLAVKVAEEDLKQIAATIDLMVRKLPEKFGLEKVTESAVEKTVILQPDYKEGQKAVRRAMSKLIDAEKNVGIMEAVVTALAHKRPALENGVKLHLAGYFASPREGSETTRELKEARADKAFGPRKKGVVHDDD